jgi:uncharacterized membrane protein YidH (DUF202 family)
MTDAVPVPNDTAMSDAGAIPLSDQTQGDEKSKSGLIQSDVLPRSPPLPACLRTNRRIYSIGSHSWKRVFMTKAALRYIACLVMALAAAPTAQAEEQSNSWHPLDTIAIAIFLVMGGSLVLSLLIWRRQGAPSPSRAVDDKFLENLRIVYGFWLIVGALLATLAVLVVTLVALYPVSNRISDVVAVIASVTGVIGTLTAAFFGIQQAAAGRSQAMTTLTQLKAQGTESVVPYKLEPSFGPHAGGTRVSISGNGFTGSNAVNFGVMEGANFEFVNDGLIRATSPAAGKGVNGSQVTVIFPSATLNCAVGTFYYYTIEPSQGPAGEMITIQGSGLQGVNAVKFGTEDGKGLRHNADGSLSAEVPPNTGAADVDVKLCYPVDAPTNSFVVGKYHYT